MNYLFIIIFHLGVAWSILYFSKYVYPLYQEKIEVNKKLEILVILLFALGLTANYFMINFLIN